MPDESDDPLDDPPDGALADEAALVDDVALSPDTAISSEPFFFSTTTLSWIGVLASCVT